jgi:hypothetical protein
MVRALLQLKAPSLRNAHPAAKFHHRPPVHRFKARVRALEALVRSSEHRQNLAEPMDELSSRR